MKVTLTRITPNPVMAIETAASECYQSQPHQNGQTILHCYQSGHESVLEHVSLTWHIEGVSRALLAQLTRHRLASFSVQSQRYVDQSDHRNVIPPSIAASPEAMSVYLQSIAVCASAYAKLQELGIPNEDARYTLQNGCETTLTCTMNLREFIHFCNERLCSRAQWEIRALCSSMADAVIDKEPFFGQFFAPKCERRLDFFFCPESEKQTCGKHKTLKKIAGTVAKEK